VTTAAPQPAATTLPTFGDLVRQFPEWVKKNLVATIVAAVVSGVVGYVFNVWLMAVRYEGSATPSGAPATSKGNFVSGGLFWALLPMVVCSVVGYRRSVGRERFWKDVRGLPMTLIGLARREGAHGRVHLLWGAAIALAASLVVSPAVGAVMGVGVLVAAPSIIGQMLSSLVSQIWYRIAHTAQPSSTSPMPPMMSAAVGLLGGAVALVAGFVLPGRTIRLVLAAACVAAAIYLGSQAKAAGAAAAVLIVVGAWAFAQVLFASRALADDGGFAECGSTVKAWLESCAGADVVRRLSAGGALIAGITGPIGTFIGGFVAGFVPPPGGGSWWEGPTGGGQPPAEGTGRGDPFEGATATGEAVQEGEAGQEGGDEEGDRPDHYRQNPVDVQGERPKPLDPDKGHTVDENGRATGPDGEDLRDPRTGDALPVDTDGNVKYGDEWMSPDDAAARAQLDAETLAARQRSQELVDKARDIKSKLDDPELDLTTRRQLEDDLRKTAIDINSDYGSKSILKSDKTGVADALDGEIKKIYGDVDPAFVDKMNELGVTRGGKPFTADDMWDVRNKSSKGLGMDRDFALNEKEIVRIREELANAEPGSERAHVLQNELLNAKANAQLEMDAGKYAEFLEAQKAGRTRAEIERIDKQIEKVNAARAAGAEKVPISPSTWNNVAQDAYGKAYGEVTGADAHKAMQGVTQVLNPEAFGDPNAIRNDVRNSPMDKARAEQTASVSPYKTFHNDEMARQGDLTAGEATMENARGYAKDMDTKLLPLLQSDPNVDPAKLGRLQAIQETMAAVGRGDILPGQADGALKVATGDPNMTMDRAMQQVDANLEAGIKGNPGVTMGERLGDVFGKATDLATFENYTKQHMADGKGLGEAMAIAASQTVAGNAAMASGVVDPTLSMVAGSMLPGGMGNLLPDQMAANTVATGWDAASALGSDIKATYTSGELSTAAIDKFAQQVADRGNADPFSGFGQAAQLAGDMYERTDGGTLSGDLQQIYQTGAGTEVLNESMANFQQQVESGQHGVVLGGYNEVLGAAGELAADPAGTVGQFVDDVKNIITQGVGDGYWEDAGMQAKNVLDKTPVVGMVAGGYEAIAEGIGEAGSVSGFVGEMGEGAAALGGEAVEAVANAGSSAVDYIKSFF
jgi:hypothetical protein